MRTRALVSQALVPTVISLIFTATIAQAQSTLNAPVPKVSSTAPADDAIPDAKEAGYSYGVNFGMQLYNLGITDEIPMEALVRGMRDGLAGKRTTAQDIEIVKHFAQEVSERTVKRNHAAANAFLDNNAKKSGIRKTASGLQYEVLAPGGKKGPSPGAKDLVTVNYTGQLLDGTEFDSSYKKGQPAKFVLSDTIQGWQEALPLMKPGAKWRLFVPPELAYGDSFKQGIPEGSLLVFDVELLSAASPATDQASSGHPDHSGNSGRNSR
jgi:FKBP-type peptidyl-prolyl cis-trans isomerase